MSEGEGERARCLGRRAQRARDELASSETADRGAGAHAQGHARRAVAASRLRVSERGRDLLGPRVRKSFISLNLIVIFVFYS